MDLKKDSEDDKYMSFEKMEAEIFDELYHKKTPLKKRLVQMHSLLSDEEKIDLKPVMKKPVKRFMESYVKSTSSFEPEQNAPGVSHVGTSEAANASSSVEMNKTADVAQAIPAAKGKRKMKKPVKRSLESHVTSTSLLQPEQNAKTLVVGNFSSSFEMNKAADVEQSILAKKKRDMVTADYNFALELLRSEFNLRRRCRKDNKVGFKTKTNLKHAKTNGASAGSKKSKSSPSKKGKNVGGRKDKKKGKKAPKKNGKKAPKKTGKKPIEVNGKDIEDIFTGAFAHKMSKLSPELADIFGQGEFELV